MPTTIVPPYSSVGAQKRHPAREKALAPYLEKLRVWIAQVADANPESLALINIGTRSVTLAGWDRLQLVEYFSDDHSADRECAELMAHAIALVLKTTFDVERLKQGESLESSRLYALQAELMLDTALGMALLDETQQAIDDWVRTGRVEDAKAISLFRHQINKAIARAKKRIADSEIQQAELLSVTLGNRRLPETRTPTAVSHARSRPVVEPIQIDGITDEFGMPERVRKRPGRPKEAKSRRGRLPGPTDPFVYPSFTKILSVALAGAVVLFAAVVLLPMPFDHRLPTVLRSDLPNANLFESVEATAPSIYATVSVERWQQSDDQERRRLIDDLGRHAASVGYTGALLRTSDGRPVARWLRERGYELIQDREELPYQAIGY